MFVRKIARDYPGGRVEYVYLVESYRDGARSRQRTVANLGRADVLAPHLDAIVRLLRPQLLTPPPAAPQSGPVRVPEALTYGPIAVAQHLWHEVGLEEILTQVCGAEVAERSFVLVAHRLLHPGSEHALAWWLDELRARCARAAGPARLAGPRASARGGAAVAAVVSDAGCPPRGQGGD
jgi:hypothetical protein